MWTVLLIVAAMLLLGFAVSKALQRWLIAPGIDFNKIYDKTML
jgi:hypothetical protein